MEPGLTAVDPKGPSPWSVLKASGEWAVAWAIGTLGLTWPGAAPSGRGYAAGVGMLMGFFCGTLIVYLRRWVTEDREGRPGGNIETGVLMFTLPIAGLFAGVGLGTCLDWLAGGVRYWQFLMGPGGVSGLILAYTIARWRGWIVNERMIPRRVMLVFVVVFGLGLLGFLCGTVQERLLTSLDPGHGWPSLALGLAFGCAFGLSVTATKLASGSRTPSLFAHEPIVEIAPEEPGHYVDR